MRDYGILIGDVPEDSQMCDMAGYKEILKIGFLTQAKATVEDYKSYFDLIISNESSLIPVSRVIKLVCGDRQMPWNVKFHQNNVAAKTLDPILKLV